MKKPLRLIITAGVIAGIALTVILWPRETTPAPPGITPKGFRAGIMPPAARLTAKQLPPRSSGENEPLLPPPAIPPAQAPAAITPQPGNHVMAIGRPGEESLMSAWAARDPEGAGHWLNNNRHLPNFADYVRGYAIQIAAINPDAARQWAAVLNGQGNRFLRGGTLEQHIDAIEEMLKGPPAKEMAAAETAPQAPSDPARPFMADYVPVLVRQSPGEEPVLEMNPVSPFG